MNYPVIVAGDAMASRKSSLLRPVCKGATNPSSHPLTAIEAEPTHTGRPTYNERPEKQRGRAPVAEKILQTFNTWAFKREQPDDPSAILDLIAETIARERPLSFVLYWGKGPRAAIAEPDTTCLDYLMSLAARVRSVYAPGAIFRLILTDTHAELNGYAPEAIQAYFREVDTAARIRKFNTCLLSTLVRDAERADAIQFSKETLSDHTLERLKTCAEKWYRGEGTPEQGAAKYYQMNMIERQAVQFAFPHSIFVTFNGSEFRDLFPERMPVFYMYSLKRGVSVKPWFMPGATITPALEKRLALSTE